MSKVINARVDKALQELVVLAREGYEITPRDIRVHGNFLRIGLHLPKPDVPTTYVQHAPSEAFSPTVEDGEAEDLSGVKAPEAETKVEVESKPKTTRKRSMSKSI